MFKLELSDYGPISAENLEEDVNFPRNQRIEDEWGKIIQHLLL